MTTIAHLSMPVGTPWRIREMPTHEQPLSRIGAVGAPSLSDAELLTLIAGLDSLETASTVLTEAGGWVGLQRLSVAQLRHLAGITPKRAAQIKAALEVGRRLLCCVTDERTQIKSPADVVNLLRLEMEYLDQEHLRTVLLDTKNRVQKVHTVSIGTVNSSQVRVAEVFKEAVRLNSTALILCHNHPSGDSSPSPEDVSVTRAIRQAGQLLEIDILDHIIIGRGNYVSMRERGLGFSS